MKRRLNIGDYVSPIIDEWQSFRYNKWYKILDICNQERANPRYLVQDDFGKGWWFFSETQFKSMPGTELGKILYE